MLRIGLGLLSIGFLLQVAGACSRSDAESQTDSEFGETSTVVVQSTPEPSDTGKSEERSGSDEMQRPPAVTVRGGNLESSLEAWTACWSEAPSISTGSIRPSSICFDGRPPKVLPDIGSPSDVVVEFPVPGWEFSATVQPVGKECGRRQTEVLEPAGDTAHRLQPIGIAGDYEVTLFGRGPEGDLFVTFRWQTTTDGVLPVPAATASILADGDGPPRSYGVELSVRNLESTPQSASAEVQVMAANGNIHTIELTRADVNCSVGRMYFTAPLSEGLAAARLGPAPFTYHVTMELDGQTYRGAGVWPDGQIDPECKPCVRLTFDPPLPALTRATATST